MAVQTPLFLQKTGADADVTYSATNFRLSLVAAVCQNTGVLDPYGSGNLTVTQRGAGANFSVDIASGYAFVPGGDVTLQGNYVTINDAVVNVVTPGAPGSGTRVHRVVLQIRDKLNNGTYTTYDGVLQVLQDTGAGTPATPASAISLATVSIAAGQASVTNANITDTRAWARWALSAGGALTAGTGWTASDATRPAYYRMGADNYVHLYGWVARTSGATFTAATLYTLATGIPAYASPTGNRDCVAATSIAGYFTRTLVQTNGQLSFQFETTKTAVTGDWISLDGITYKI